MEFLNKFNYLPFHKHIFCLCRELLLKSNVFEILDIQYIVVQSLWCRLNLLKLTSLNCNWYFSTNISPIPPFSILWETLFYSMSATVLDSTNKWGHGVLFFCVMPFLFPYNVTNDTQSFLPSLVPLSLIKQSQNISIFFFSVQLMILLLSTSSVLDSQVHLLQRVR